MAPPGFPPPRRSRAGWVIAGGAIALALAALIAIGVRNGGAGVGAGHSFAVAAIPPRASTSAPGPDEQGGLFRVQSQPEQAPVIAVGNSSPYELRLSIRNVAGVVTTEMIPMESTQSVTVPEGHYDALIDAPDAYGINPLSGTVDVKDFRHYEADFGVGPEMDASPGFHIGD